MESSFIQLLKNWHLRLILWSRVKYIYYKNNNNNNFNNKKYVRFCQTGIYIPKEECKKRKKELGKNIYYILAKIVWTIGIFKRFQLFLLNCHYHTYKTNYCRHCLRWKESAGTLKKKDCPLKVPATPSNKFGASWKINWTDLLYIQRKVFAWVAEGMG